MKNKRNWLALLVIVLVFGMTVMGCDDLNDDQDNKPYLDGVAYLDISHPVIGETLRAKFITKSDDRISMTTRPDPIGTPSWRWYKTDRNISYVNDVENETYIGSGTSYTIKQSDVGYWIWAFVRYSGNDGFVHTSTSSTVMSIPATATVSISMNAEYIPSSSYQNHRVTITLTLSDGRWGEGISVSDIPYSTASQWLTISGTPSVTSWSNPSVSARGKALVFSYNTMSNTTLSINNLTATLNTTQLSTMRNSTNVYNTLTAGNPSTVSVSQWTISQY